MFSFVLFLLLFFILSFFFSSVWVDPGATAPSPTGLIFPCYFFFFFFFFCVWSCRPGEEKKKEKDIKTYYLATNLSYNVLLLCNRLVWLLYVGYLLFYLISFFLGGFFVASIKTNKVEEVLREHRVHRNSCTVRIIQSALCIDVYHDYFLARRHGICSQQRRLIKKGKTWFKKRISCCPPPSRLCQSIPTAYVFGLLWLLLVFSGFLTERVIRLCPQSRRDDTQPSNSLNSSLTLARVCVCVRPPGRGRRETLHLPLPLVTRVTNSHRDTITHGRSNPPTEEQIECDLNGLCFFFALLQGIGHPRVKI